MLLRFDLPQLSAASDSGTLVEWRVEPGQDVAYGDPVCVIRVESVRRMSRSMGPKASMTGRRGKTKYRTMDGASVLFELASMEQGVLSSRLAQAGQVVRTGSPLALIATSRDDPAPAAAHSRVPAGRMTVNLVTSEEADIE